MGNAVGQTTFASLPGLSMPAHLDGAHSAPGREMEVTDSKGKPTSLYLTPSLCVILLHSRERYGAATPGPMRGRMGESSSVPSIRFGELPYVFNWRGHLVYFGLVVIGGDWHCSLRHLLPRVSSIPSLIWVLPRRTQIVSSIIATSILWAQRGARMRGTLTATGPLLFIQLRMMQVTGRMSATLSRHERDEVEGVLAGHTYIQTSNRKGALEKVSPMI